MAEVSTSLSAYKIMRPHFTTEAEEIWVLALDSKLSLIGHKMVFRGTVNSCPIHPRDIFRYLILQNACAFILAHNHPSQDPNPSEQDIQVTRNLEKLSRLLEIPLIDHIVMTQDKYYSFADFNLLELGKKTTARRRRRT
jgi:DNA repair protein RadC